MRLSLSVRTLTLLEGYPGCLVRDFLIHLRWLSNGMRIRSRIRYDQRDSDRTAVSMQASESVDVPIPQATSRGWTGIALALALFGMPLVVGLISAYVGPRTTTNTLGRELAIFAMAAFVAYIIRQRERRGWDSVGLARPALANTALWVLIALLGTIAAIAVSFGIIKLFGLRFGSSGSGGIDALPTWVILLVIVRAGFVEEFFYRGYAIERLEMLTRNRLVAAAIPLALFAVFHYRQGAGGIVIALLTGAVLTAVYLQKRNLWIGIITHFLVDFVPNILLPLLVSE
jgi:membrane protease YdiL (CAAX protease family)